MSQPTPNKQVTLHRIPKTPLQGLFVVFTLFVLLASFSLSLLAPAAPAAAAVTNNTVNFSARLQGSGGNIAPDGYYNVQFKLYGANTGGTALWTETYQDVDGSAGTTGDDFRIRVQNGYLTVNLGSRTAFPDTINWDQDLYITMNVGGTAQVANPAYDGEMNPRLRLTGVPYAFRAGQLAQFNQATGFTSTLNLIQPTVGHQAFQIADQGAAGTYTLCVQSSAACGFAAASGGSGYIQNQTASPQVANFYIQAANNGVAGTVGGIIRGAANGQTADLLQLQDSNGNTMTSVDKDGNIAFSNSYNGGNARIYSGGGQINIGTQALGTLIVSPTASTGVASVMIDNVTGNVASIGLAIKAKAGQTGDLIQVQDSTGVTITSIDASGNLAAQNATIAAGKSITLVGGATNTRPAAPSEGMLYYDTTTKQLLVYTGGKWQSDGSAATKIVAASNSSQSTKDGAHYVANGEDSAGAGIGTLDGDQIEINQALDAVEALGGGMVYLTEGTYTIDAAIRVPNNTTLAGAGAATLIQFGNFGGTATSIRAVVNKDQTTGTQLTLRDFRLDGRRSVNTNGAQNGVELSYMGDGSGSSARRGGKVSGLWVSNFKDSGIAGLYTDNSTFINNTAHNNGATGMALLLGNNNTVSGNITQGNGTIGIYLAASTGNTVTGNTTQGNGIGISIDNSSKSTVTGNTVNGNTTGIYLATSNSSTVSANKLDGNGGTTANEAILLNAADDNSITSNDITDTSCTTTCYAINISNSTSDANYLADNRFSDTDATYNSSIQDLGTGTIFANQMDGAGNLRNTTSGTNIARQQTGSTADIMQIQAAGGTSLLSVTAAGTTVLRGATTANDAAVLSIELFTAANSFNAATNWTAISGTGQSATATHTPGNSSGIGTNFSPVFGATYRVTFTVSGNTADNYVSMSMGGGSSSNIYDIGTSTYSQLITAYSSAQLVFFPSTGFAGSVTGVSIVEITRSNSTLKLADSTGVAKLEIRVGGTANTFIGLESGTYRRSGSYNTSLGANSLQSTVSASSNTAIGAYSMLNTTSGSNNTALGMMGLYYNTTGFSNVSIGWSSLFSNSSGYRNVAVGENSLYANSAGVRNVALGASALYANSTGSNNLALGSFAGDNITTGSNNIIIGNAVDAASATDSYQLNIGNLLTGSWAAGNESLTVSGNTTIAAGKSISLVGGATNTRPASPTEGMLYYDQTTKQLLVYSNGKWQADRSSNTVIVGTSAVGGTSSAVASKNPTGADFANASDTSAQVVIEQAIAALPSTGGSVYLMEGTYIVDDIIDVPSNVRIHGAGPSTILKINNSHNVFMRIFRNADTANGNTGITISHMKLDGNKANITDGTDQRGVSLAEVAKGTSTNVGATIHALEIVDFEGIGLAIAASRNVNVDNVSISNGNDVGLYIWLGSERINVSNVKSVGHANGSGISINSAEVSVSSSSVVGNSNGISLNSLSENIRITGVKAENNTNDGLFLAGQNTVVSNSMFTGNTDGIRATGDNNTITGSTFKNNLGDCGIWFNGSTDNAVSGNNFTGNWAQLCMTSGSNRNTISGNNLSASGSTGINLSDSNENLISNNTMYDNAGNTSNSSILVNNADNNTIQGNAITDTAGTGFAIDISNSTSDLNKLVGNQYSGTGAASIQDLGTGTVYSNQLDGSGSLRNTTSGSLVTRLQSGSSADLFQSQDSSGNALFSIGSTGALTVGRSNTGSGGTTGSIVLANSSNNFKVTVLSGVTSADYSLTLPTIGAGGQKCLASTSGSTTDATSLEFINCASGGTGGVSNLQGAYDGGNTVAMSGSTGIYFRDAGTPMSKAFAVQNSGASYDYFAVSSTGLNVQRAAGTTAMSFAMSSGVGELRVMDPTDAAKYAVIKYTGNTAIFGASSGVTQIGNGSGSINMNLAAAAEQLNVVKTLSGGTGYSTSDFNFSRSLTNQSTAVSGAMFTLTDASSGTTSVTGPLARFNQSNSAVTSNLLELQKAGASQFSVGHSGSITAATTGNTINGLVINGGSLTNVGANITGAGAVHLASGSGSALTLSGASGNARIVIDSTAGTVSIGGVSDTTSTLLVLDTFSNATEPTGVNGAMYYSSLTNKFRCFENGSWKDCTGGRTVVKTANQNHNTVAPADITDLTMPVLANTNYSFECTIFFQAGATANGWLVTATAPASPTSFIGQAIGPTSAVGVGMTTWTANDGGVVLGTSGFTTAANGIKVSGILRNGANAGNIQMRFASELTTTTHVIQQGSWCSYSRL